MSTAWMRQWSRNVDLSLILGIGGTVAFYAVVLQPAMHETLLARYTTEHPVDYAIVALFLWGLADLTLKSLSLPRELFALKQSWMPARSGRQPATDASTLLSSLQTKSRWMQGSRIAQRISKALEHVVENGANDEYHDHLKYLADKAEDDTYGRYTLIRFVIAVTPILGFLGTVVHFGSALGGISFDQMADRLPQVVSEMGEAFNTTTVALGAAMTMMFGMFLCERVENGIDRFTDRYVEHELLNRFEMKHQGLTPFLSVVQSANEDALRQIAMTLHQQIAVWTQSMEMLFKRFDTRQAEEASSWTQALALLEERHQSAEAQHDQRLAQTLVQLETRQAQHVQQIQKSLDGIGLLRDDLKDVGRTFQSIAQGEGRLLELQQVLTDNLRVLRETQQIDEALHQLTAAIHLLTTRYRPGGSFDTKAA